MKPKILLFGANGQLGWHLQRSLATEGEVVALTRQEADLENPAQVVEQIALHLPQVIINAAAYTSVDGAERERSQAMQVNGVMPAIMAAEAKRLNAWFLHYSTDYVFDGQACRPYLEDDFARPLNFYGESKLAGERAVAEVGGRYMIFRTSWLYGERGHNFLKMMLRLAESGGALSVVADQLGSPTFSRLVAEATAQVLLALRLLEGGEGAAGIYHLTAAGYTSWYGFAEKIFSWRQHLLEVAPPELTPIESNAFPSPAKRPHFGVLSNAKLESRFGIALPSWEEGLLLCLHDLWR